jgi:hypothetical protein
VSLLYREGVIHDLEHWEKDDVTTQKSAKNGHHFKSTILYERFLFFA